MIAVGLGSGAGLSGGLARHASLDLAELGLAGEKLLALLVDLALDLELDFAKLLLLAAELLLLEADGLRSKILGVHRVIAMKRLVYAGKK